MTKKEARAKGWVGGGGGGYREKNVAVSMTRRKTEASGEQRLYVDCRRFRGNVSPRRGPFPWTYSLGTRWVQGPDKLPRVAPLSS
jgi:hypothetical protein